MDLWIVGIYLAIVLAIGIWASRGLTHMRDFSVAGKAFSSFVVFATLSASFIGGGYSMGNAEKVFRYGVFSVFALWGFSLKELLVAYFIAPRMNAFPDAISVGDVMEKSYGRLAKVVTGIFSVILCAGILGAQVGGIGYIFEVFIGLPQFYGILIGVGIVTLYSAIGGMRAVVFTDIFQFLVLSIGIPLTLVLGIQHLGGFDSWMAKLPATHFSFEGMDISWIGFASLFLTFLLGETLVPPYVQRLFIGKDTGHTMRGTLYSGLFSIPFFLIAGSIGLVALALNADLNPNLAMPYVIKTVLPIGLRGLVIAGVISIVMSSADSFLNSAAVALVHDVVKPLSRREMKGKQELQLARFATVGVGILAVWFAVSIKSILDILIYSYNFWSPIVLIPLAAALLGYKVQRLQFIAGSVLGALGVALWNFAFHQPYGIDGLIVGVICNAIGFFLVPLIRKEVS